MLRGRSIWSRPPTQTRPKLAKAAQLLVVLVCLGVIVLRRTNRERPRPFRVPLVPVFPLLGVFFCFALMLSLPLETWGRFFIWLLIGLSIYFAYSVRHSKLRRGVDTGITEDIPPPLIKT